MLTIKRIMKNKRKEKRSCRLILTCCALLLFISVNAFAQQQVTVTGNVKDEKGEPIIGANVIVKGTGTGSVTNVEGDFSLANVQNGAILEISFIGYLNQDVKVNGQAVATLIAVPYRCLVGKYLRPGVNTLEVEVTNLPANRIADMDRRDVPWRIYKDANIVNIHYKKDNYGKWEPVPSGLLGPVHLIPMQTLK